MNTKRLNAGLSALALCIAAGGVYQGVAVAGERSAAQTQAAARDNAAKAWKALAKRDAAEAVRYAELAVAMDPQSASYRAMLGQSYLLAGRFGSATTSLKDSLSLSPGNGKAALNLALAQIAEGDWQGARTTLDSNSASISTADRGLALALAGDPVAAVDLMLPVARQPGADAKLRQNLALALALSGRWQDARTVAAMDLSPIETDKRMEQWAAFARPTGRADQVASLLGVRPAYDPGQPVALALNAPAPVAVAAVAPTPVVAEAPAPVVVAAPEPVADPMVVPKPAVSGVVFAPRAEVVQPLAAKPAVGLAPAKPKNFVKPVVATKTTPGASSVGVKPVVGKGNFVVQLGAYDSAGVARDGWARASRAFSGYAPQGMPITVAGKTYYRLSVGGFDEAGAKRLCSNYRAKGGRCFVRAGAGDTAASWTKK